MAIIEKLQRTKTLLLRGEPALPAENQNYLGGLKPHFGGLLSEVKTKLLRHQLLGHLAKDDLGYKEGSSVNFQEPPSTSTRSYEGDESNQGGEGHKG